MVRPRGLLRLWLWHGTLPGVCCHLRTSCVAVSSVLERLSSCSRTAISWQHCPLQRLRVAGTSAQLEYARPLKAVPKLPIAARGPLEAVSLLESTPFLYMLCCVGTYINEHAATQQTRIGSLSCVVAASSSPPASIALFRLRALCWPPARVRAWVGALCTPPYSSRSSTCCARLPYTSVLQLYTQFADRGAGYETHRQTVNATHAGRRACRTHSIQYGLLVSTTHT